MLKRKVNIPKVMTRAQFQPETVNEEKRTVDVIVTTEKPVRRGFWNQFDEVLDMKASSVRMARMQAGAPLLDSHRAWGSVESQLGVVEKAWLEGTKMHATVRFPKAEDDEKADKVFRKVKDGILRNISVGYIVHKYEKQPKKDLNDEKEIPVYRATDWEPMEVSLVTVPADENAGVRSQEQDSRELNECEFIEPEIQKEDSDMLLKTRMVMDKAGEGGGSGGGASAPTINEAEIRAAAQKAERERQAGIREFAKKSGTSEELVKRLLDEGIDLASAKEQMLEDWTKRGAAATPPSAAPTVEVTESEGEKFRDGVSQWLMQRAGPHVSGLVEKQTGKKLDGGEFRGMSLVDIARECLERAGVKTRGMDKMTLVGKAFTHRSGSGYQTVSDFPIILENTLHKVLLGAYATTPDTWSRFCKKGSVSDFRAHPRYRLGSFGSLDSLTEHGEFKNKSIPDGEKSSITASTKGNIIGISRQAIVNDDMGAFNDLATRFGRAAKLSVEVDVYALLALNSGLGPTQSDSQPLFHSNRANVGTGAALSAAAIDGDRVVMGLQKDPSGNEILDLKPAILLVPLSLGGQARIINTSQYDPDTVANKAQMKPNVVAGLFRDVVDTGRLSGTRRYLFADPSIAPVIEVAFLDGQENPFMETQDGFRMDGVEWKVRLDYGVAAVDHRGAVTNAGA